MGTSGQPFGRAERRVVGVTAAYLLAAALVAAWRGNQEFVFYIGVMVALVVAVVAVHRRVGLGVFTLGALSLWGFLHMAGGLVPVPEAGVLYNVWLVPGRLKFDQLVHAYGFAVATLVCWQGLRGMMADPAPRAGPLVLVAAAGMGLGALNEVVEFAATRLVPNTNVGGYENTGWDLVANLVGAVLAVVAIRVLEGRRRRRATATGGEGRTSG